MKQREAKERSIGREGRHGSVFSERARISRNRGRPFITMRRLESGKASAGGAASGPVLEEFQDTPIIDKSLYVLWATTITS
jgi:hypothetical protein